MMTITKTVPELERALARCLAGIKPADEAVMEEARQRQAQLAKPPGSLGKLEDISIRLAGMTGRVHNKMDRCRIIVLCADNGVVAEGVACAPQSVTLAQTLNLTRGKTGASCLAKHFGDEVVVVDMGVNAVIRDPKVLDRKIAMGTRDLYLEPAMTRQQALQAILVGIELADQAAADHVTAVGVGEMGIGNTTTSSAVLCALTGAAVADVTGRGGGVNDEGFRRKKQVIAEALEKHRPNAADPVDVLQKVGGFDLCAMCGVFLGCAKNRVPVVIDGFISVVAALCAARLCGAARDYFFASHESYEIGYQLAEKELGLEPWLVLGMRLGEGSGCTVAFRVMDAACAVINEMATFAEGAIDDGYLDEIRANDSFTVDREAP